MRARALATIVMLSCLAPASASAEGTGAPGFPCLGRWQGVGRTTGYTTTWTIDMNVTAPTAEGDCGTIEYTNPTCGGRMLGCRIENGLVHVREHYTHTDGECAPPSRLEFSCDGDRMQWAWVGWEIARSTLTRVGPPPAPPAPGIAQVPPPPAPPAPPPPAPPAETVREESVLGCGCSVPGGSRRGSIAWLVALALFTSGCRARRGAAERGARARRGVRAG